MIIKASFEHLYDWIDEVNRLTNENPVKLVIANKRDLHQLSSVNQEDYNVLID